jgi:hypothetical protein
MEEGNREEDCIPLLGDGARTRGQEAISKTQFLKYLD